MLGIVQVGQLIGGDDVPNVEVSGGGQVLLTVLLQLIYLVLQKKFQKLTTKLFKNFKTIYFFSHSQQAAVAHQLRLQPGVDEGQKVLENFRRNVGDVHYPLLSLSGALMAEHGPEDGRMGREKCLVGGNFRWIFGEVTKMTQAKDDVTVGATVQQRLLSQIELLRFSVGN